MSSEAAVACAGTVGSVLALSATYPLLTLNTRQQTEGKKDGKGHKKESAITSLLKTIEKDGAGELYKGLKPALFGTAVSQLVYFYFYSILRDAAVQRQGKQLKPGQKGNLSALEALGVASVAGAINVILTNPFWVVVTRMQTNKKTHEHKEGANPAKTIIPAEPTTDSAWTVIRDVWGEGGARSFWKGVMPSLLMVSNPAIQFMLYEWLFTQRNRLHKKSPTAGQIFTIGAVAKTGATVVTYPMLLVKSRMQAMSKTTDESMKYKGTLDAVARIAKQEGVGGFYEGMRTKIVQSVLTAALMYTLKEKIDRAVRKAMIKT